MKINGSVVLITGAAMRVGRHMALHLAGQGANISFSYLSDDEPWQDTLAEIKKVGVDAIANQADVRKRADISNLVQKTIDKFDRIDVLINNASVWLRAPLLDITEEEWDMAMDINLKGPFMTSQLVAPHMMAQGSGVMINITDISAFQVWTEYAHHAASKAGLVSLTKSLAAELAPSVRVNAIAPGTVLLPDNAPPAKKQWAIDKSLLKRVGSPDDVAHMAQFLIENDFTTGAVYFMDGGRALT